MPSNNKLPSVITVLGPVNPLDMGITDAHNHIWINSVPGSAPNSPVLNQTSEILAELEDYRRLGGGGQIDCQPGGCGRNGVKLVELSRLSGINIVASTGFHRRCYYSVDTPLFSFSAEAACDYFLDEIKNGLVETRNLTKQVFPGQIKIAVESSLSMSSMALLEAAAYVCRLSGLAIQMHTERGTDAEAFLEFFINQGVSPLRLIFCHMDKRPDFCLHAEIARAGVMLEYDTFFRSKYEPEKYLWPLILEIVEVGLNNSLALATDMADAYMWSRIGKGSGLGGFVTDVKRRLEMMQFEPDLISGLMGENITNRLAIPIKE
jgi:5-phospho-D-xylono-1,4-lactonase